MGDDDVRSTVAGFRFPVSGKGGPSYALTGNWKPVTGNRLFHVTPQPLEHQPVSLLDYVSETSPDSFMVVGEIVTARARSV